MLLKAFDQIFSKRFSKKIEDLSFLTSSFKKYININTKLTDEFNLVLANKDGLVDESSKMNLSIVYNKIYERLNKNQNQSKLEELFNCFNNQFKIGVLTIYDHKAIEELEYFENMNSKGKSLELHEKIKVFILTRIDESIFNNKYQENQIINFYNKHFSNTKILDDFFVHFCRIQKKLLDFAITKEINKKNAYDYFKKLFLCQNKSMFSDIKEYESLILKISKYFKIFKAIKDKKFLEISNFRHLSPLKMHRRNAILPLFIYLLSKLFEFDNKQTKFQEFFKKPLNDDVLKKTIEIIELYIVRNISFTTGESLSKYFDNCIKKIKKSLDDDIKEIPSILWNYFKNDSTNFQIKNQEEFKKDLENRGGIQESSAIFIFQSIERFIEKTNRNAFDKNNEHKNPTIEHIMPKILLDNSEWYMLQQHDLFKIFLTMIGNLAILDKSKNSDIRNKSFNDKKEIFIKEKSTHHIVGIKYPSQLDSIASYKEWDFETIKIRSKQIANIAADYVFKNREYK